MRRWTPEQLSEQTIRRPDGATFAATVRNATLVGSVPTLGGARLTFTGYIVLDGVTRQVRGAANQVLLRRAAAITWTLQPAPAARHYEPALDLPAPLRGLRRTGSLA